MTRILPGTEVVAHSAGARLGWFPTPEIRLEEPPEPSLGSLFGVLRRRKIVILVTAVLGTAISAAVMLQFLDVYSAASLVKIETAEPTHLSTLQATTSALPPDVNAVVTEVDVIRSPNIAGRVVRKLDLANNHEIMAQGGGLRGVLTSARERLGFPAPASAPLTADQQADQATRKLLDLISVDNNGRSYVIKIAAETRNPALSAAIANAFATVYVDFRREQKSDGLRKSNVLLNGHLTQLRLRMVEAEQAAQVFRQQNGLTLGRSTQGGGEMTVSAQQLLETSTQLTVAAGERAQKMAELEQLDALAKAGRLSTAPRARSSPVVQRLTEQEAEISSREADLASRYGSASPAMQAVQAQRRDIERKINEEVSKVIAGAQSEAAAASDRENKTRAALNQLRAQVDVQGTASIRLRELEAEAATDRTLYDDFLSRVKRTASDENMQLPSVNIVSTAAVPLLPSGPPRAQIVMLAGAASLVLGALLALGLELGENGLRSIEEFERATGLPVLGFLPSARGGPRFDLRQQSSQFLEAVNFTRLRLQHSDRGELVKTFLITSAVPDEGKTTLALALATSAAQAGDRVLFIDCDLRRSRITAALNLPRKAGLTALFSDGPIDDIIARAVVPGLDVIPSGAGLAEPAAALGSFAMRLLVLQARTQYDLVILDAPPVMTVADALPLSMLADATILVARWRRTPGRLVLGALTTLQRYGASMVGGVLTRTDLRKAAQLDASSQPYVLKRYGYYLKT